MRVLHYYSNDNIYVTFWLLVFLEFNIINTLWNQLSISCLDSFSTLPRVDPEILERRFAGHYLHILAQIFHGPLRWICYWPSGTLLFIPNLHSYLICRFSQSDPNKFETRHPLIAALCGGSQNTQGIPLWKHDVIVATAGIIIALLCRPSFTLWVHRTIIGLIK